MQRYLKREVNQEKPIQPLRLIAAGGASGRLEGWVR